MEKYESFIEKIVAKSDRKNRFLCTAPDVIDFVMNYTTRDEETRELTISDSFSELTTKQLARLNESFNFIDDLRQNHEEYANEIYPCFLISDEEFAGLVRVITNAATEQV